MKAQTLYFLRVQHSHGSTKLDVVVREQLKVLQLLQCQQRLWNIQKNN